MTTTATLMSDCGEGAGSSTRGNSDEGTSRRPFSGGKGEGGGAGTHDGGVVGAWTHAASESGGAVGAWAHAAAEAAEASALDASAVLDPGWSDALFRAAAGPGWSPLAAVDLPRQEAAGHLLQAGPAWFPPLPPHQGQRLSSPTAQPPPRPLGLPPGASSVLGSLSMKAAAVKAGSSRHHDPQNHPDLHNQSSPALPPDPITFRRSGPSEVDEPSGHPPLTEQLLGEAASAAAASAASSSAEVPWWATAFGPHGGQVGEG